MIDVASVNERFCDTCGWHPAWCICLTPAQVAAYVTGGDNARWLKRGERVVLERREGVTG